MLISKKLILAASLAVLGLTQGCANNPVPNVVTTTQESQKDIHSISLWRTMALDIHQRVLPFLQEEDGTISNQTVTVLNDKAGVFNDATASFLIEELGKQGANIVPDSKDSVYSIVVDAKKISHKPIKLKEIPNPVNGVLAGMLVYRASFSNPSAAVIEATRNVITAWSAYKAMKLDTSEEELKRVTFHEILVTTQVVKNNKEMVRFNDIYYIEKADFELYFAKNRVELDTVTIQMAAPATPAVEEAPTTKLTKTKKLVKPVSSTSTSAEK